MKKEINWWVPILKGLVFFALGIYVINQPDESMEAFITSLGLILILIGIGLTAFAYYTRHKLAGHRNYLILGIVQIGLGIFMLMDQNVSQRLLEITLGVVVGFSGVVNFLIANNLRKENVPYWTWVLFTSLFELSIAIIFIFFPSIGGLTLMTLLGVGMIVFGMANVMIGINLKRSINYIKKLSE